MVEGLEELNPSLVVAYTHHNLLGRHLVGAVQVASSARRLDRWYAISGQLALPLNRADALELTINRSHSDSESALTIGGQRLGTYAYRSAVSAIGVSWRHDTTDDPFGLARAPVPRR